MIRAIAPLTRMFGYSTELRSLTQGRGTFIMQFSHYDKAVNQEERDPARPASAEGSAPAGGAFWPAGSRVSLIDVYSIVSSLPDKPFSAGCSKLPGDECTLVVEPRKE